MRTGSPLGLGPPHGRMEGGAWPCPSSPSEKAPGLSSPWQSQQISVPSQTTLESSGCPVPTHLEDGKAGSPRQPPTPWASAPAEGPPASDWDSLITQ